MTELTVKWEGKKGEQVPVWVTRTGNRLFKLVPLSWEGGAKLSEAALILSKGFDLAEPYGHLSDDQA